MNLDAWCALTKSKTALSAIMRLPRATSEISTSGHRHCKPMWSSSANHPDWLLLTEASGTAPTKRRPPSWEENKWFCLPAVVSAPAGQRDRNSAGFCVAKAGEQALKHV